MSCGLAHGMVACFNWNSNHDFNEKFYNTDVSTYLLSGPDGPLRYYEAVEFWSTSNFDSRQRSFVPGNCLHYLTKNKKYLYSFKMKYIPIFSLLRSGDVHPQLGPRTRNSVCSKEQPNLVKLRKLDNLNSHVLHVVKV